jgi:hypothetical protein
MMLPIVYSLSRLCLDWFHGGGGGVVPAPRALPPAPVDVEERAGIRAVA